VEMRGLKPPNALDTDEHNPIFRPLLLFQSLAENVYQW